ncbi:MAG: glycoside hydrolase family protein [Puniceicoccales bacterium]|jgi:hypothetical protein|nr:glycoside hydrolase family protein [Puniceicoccales bacterium]
MPKHFLPSHLLTRALPVSALAFSALLAPPAGAAEVAPDKTKVTQRALPPEWKQLVPGGRFMDRFEPMRGSRLSSDTWGAPNVIPRLVDNGIEEREYSYWGGNILRGEDGRYHLFVCGWLEKSPRGHAEWGNSDVFHAVSDTMHGPFKRVAKIGIGHNPEVYRAKNGKYVLDVSGGAHVRGRYLADSLDGPWKFEKRIPAHSDRRDRANSFGDNFTFASREDGSVIMVPRNGQIWISKDGLDTFFEVGERCYPKLPGNYEDPVIWRDNVQYNLIVNDWRGRIAWYLRSKNGVDWVIDPGEAYVPGVSRHAGGGVEDWFKYERMKIFQDAHGRAIQANWAVIDVFKNQDRGGDNHSSKNITVPINPGRLLEILDAAPVSAKDSKTIRVKIASEPGFDAQADVDIPSLRFGANSEVNYGRGAAALSSEKVGADLVVTFDGPASGITPDEFAPKLLGRTVKGGLLYGYARLPGVKYVEPILSSRMPVADATARDGYSIETQNFGQVASEKAELVIFALGDGGAKTVLARATVPALQPYAKATVELLGASSPKLELNAGGTRYRIAIYDGFFDAEKKPLSVFEYAVPKPRPAAKPAKK